MAEHHDQQPETAPRRRRLPWPRLASHWSETRIARVIGPMQEFIQSSSSSGIVLLAATLLALVLANSPLGSDYEAWLGTYIGIEIGPFVLRETLLHWINDGLMAIFFFQVGLEIKREVWAGELSNPRAALFPVLVAIGGAVVPAGIYVAANLGGAGMSGWGVPMATDIAFALGILALLGNRVPFGLKILLTAIAIIDDLIAVLVIALFYSGEIDGQALLVGLGALALLALANVGGVRNVPFYALLGVVVWAAFLQSGVHATVAGVLVALTVPVRHRINQETFVGRVRALVDRFEESSKREPYSILQDEEQQIAVLQLEEACEEVQAPLQKMEHSLHNWVSYGIVPVFALANAGVTLSLDGLGGAGGSIALGIVLGLLIGKPLGLLGAAWLAVRAGVASLPQGIAWRHMVGLAILGGVGFTMSLFIATLAFGTGEALETAKLGILAASLVAGVAGYIYLRLSERNSDEGEERPG